MQCLAKEECELEGQEGAAYNQSQPVNLLKGTLLPQIIAENCIFYNIIKLLIKSMISYRINLSLYLSHYDCKKFLCDVIDFSLVLHPL